MERPIDRLRTFAVQLVIEYLSSTGEVPRVNDHVELFRPQICQEYVTIFLT